MPARPPPAVVRKLRRLIGTTAPPFPFRFGAAGGPSRLRPGGTGGRPRSARRPVASGVPRLPALVTLAQHLLVELADARLGHRVDDLDGVRERPLGDLRPEVVEDLAWLEPRPG